MNLNDCFLLGSIVKTHGFKGQIVLKLNKEISELPSKMEQLFVENKGQLIPFFVLELSQNNDTLTLKFEDIHTDIEAKKWIKSQVYVLKKSLPKVQSDAFQPQKYINYKVFDAQKMEVGVIDMVYEIPNNPLFAITHTLGKEILLPAISNFVVEIETKAKKIYFDFPEGLLDIYLEENKSEKPDEE